MAALPIPIVALAGTDRRGLLRALPAQAEALLATSRRAYGALPLTLAGRLGRRWLERNRNPYADELAALAATLGDDALYALNLSYEWCCSTLVGPDPGGRGARLLRTLDWPLAGLGGNLAIARADSPAGAYLDLTWPGFVGTLTVAAPGRFAAAINQAPLRHHVGVVPLDWLSDRIGVWRSGALPPAHLLGLVAETGRDFAEARTALAETPICLPALFALTGTAPEDACIIECEERSAVVHDGSKAIANDWLSPGRRGWPRGTDNEGRRCAMAELSHTPLAGFEWLVPPIANPMTRLAACLNAATGELLAQGFEAAGPVTAPTWATGGGAE
ncbi:MAG: hypothetical protein EXQ96_02520 [Alphaproteobacteria bacterium]|nr:hypothetical protein [Alphaproteobacteria bacterium]